MLSQSGRVSLLVVIVAINNAVNKPSLACAQSHDHFQMLPDLGTVISAVVTIFFSIKVKCFIQVSADFMVKRQAAWLVSSLPHKSSIGDCITGTPFPSMSGIVSKKIRYHCRCYLDQGYTVGKL